ncbi:MAG: hypothetical protein PWQ53_391 [Bacteroidota bacterium]|jgi:hypothetical protein|nr:hypothetical protein [Methermicoccus sp.]MBZ4674978.1 hypothetical protein [Dysgonamonadaceae bacterium]MDK2837495.1 hypothetical protein [Bacteroidota bacterium]MDN5296919.1 hypothetical protein [Bacteroidota bacterium]MDN5305732.1 hypothetical protein [Bacteroidota bacterium]
MVRTEDTYIFENHVASSSKITSYQQSDERAMYFRTFVKQKFEEWEHIIK